MASVAQDSINNSELFYEQLKNEWLKYWSEKSEIIIQESWLSKYGDYVDDEALKLNEAQNSIEYKFSESEENFKVIDTEANCNDWNLLWIEHCEEEYLKNYQKFYTDFHKSISSQRKYKKEPNIHCIKSEYYQNNEVVEDLSESYDDETENDEDDIELVQTDDYDVMKLYELPLSFGKPQKNTKTKKRSKRKSKSKSSESINEKTCDIKIELLEKITEEVDPFINMNVEKLVALNSDSKIIKRKRKNKNRKLPKEIRKNKNLIKYWRRRFSLFSRYSEGIKLDEESWFSVTPESIAINIAERLKCNVIIDAFCGCGGNAIQFAFTCDHVIAIDICETKIQFAKHNAKIYGVEKKIDFIIGDSLNIIEDLQADVIFLSPPWGGPKYLKNYKEYDIETNLQPIGASKLVEICRKVTNNIALYLPRNSNLDQIKKLAGSGNTMEIASNYINDKLVALTAFYGNLIQNDLNSD